MPYEHSYLYLRFGGHFGNSATTLSDYWSTGLKIGSPVASVTYDAVKLAALVTSTSAALTVLHQAAGTLASTNCYLDWVTGARIGVDGKYDPDTQETVRLDRTPFPGLSTITMPYNTAHVISLRTTRPRGYASNGRLYYPMLAGTVQGQDGRMAPSVVTGRINAFKTFLDAVNVAANTYEAGFRLIVASAVGTGRSAFVTSIRADNRIDSIERRENNQPSTWTTATLA